METIAELFNLTGKAAVVTGGGMGIGEAISFRLAEAGAGVMVADLDLEAARNTVEQIEAKGGKAKAIKANASSAADAAMVVQATVESFGSIDILVNNAGVYPWAPALEITEDMWNLTHNVNLKGVFLYCQAAAGQMAKAGNGGKIINIASKEGINPSPSAAASYIASKGGVVMLSKALALELAPHHILVNVVAPGGVKTPGTRSNVPDRADLIELSKMTKAHTPLGRSAVPDEIAKVVLFLASRAADYMTGVVLPVDGGYLLA